MAKGTELAAGSAPAQHVRVRMYAGALMVLAAAIASEAGAAVYKCKGADGKIIYSGTPCVGEGEAIPSRRLGGNTVAAPIEAAPGPEPVSQPRAESAQPRKCYEASELRDIDVRLTSQIYSSGERAFLAEERGRVVGCALARFTPEERAIRLDALRQLGRSDKSRPAQSTILGLYDRHRAEAERTAAPDGALRR